MSTFDYEFAEEFALSNKSLITILDEAIEGEIALEDASIDKVKALLYRVASQVKETAPKPAPPKKTGKVGQRKPKRDKTGESHGST